MKDKDKAKKKEPPPLCKREWMVCLESLETIAKDEASVPREDLETFERHVARIYKRVRKERRRSRAKAKNQEDRALLAKSEIVKRAKDLKEPTNPTEPLSTDREKPRQLNKSRRCYCCLEPYKRVHEFYHFLCPSCGERNLLKREQRADLRGRYALVTGGRVKIGFETALKLLRDGANVTVTTRFPKDAKGRYEEEKDVQDWRHRLTIKGLDFRFLPRLLQFIDEFNGTIPHLDILINNAAQTVRMAQEEYEALSASEAPLTLLEQSKTMKSKELLNLLPALPSFIDKRESNGWTKNLDEVQPVELLEVLLVNTAAPFILTGRLKKAFLRSPHRERFVINVTGRDGHFTKSFKSTAHPHVNMSKASLNMLTRTSAADFEKSGIFMNSVDVGWVSLEGAYSKRVRMMKEEGFVPPLDARDGAARIYDPIVRGLGGEELSGLLLKNFEALDF